jgi:hypothetical protein
MRRIAFLLLSYFLCTAVWSAEPPISVKLEASGDDSVGQRLVYRIKEGLRRSSRFDLVEQHSFGLEISIVTVEGVRDNPGNSTVFSVIWVWNNLEQPYPFYITSEVGYCGSKRIQECAEGLVASTNKYSSQVPRDLFRR